MALTITHAYVSTVAEAPGSGVPGGRVGPNEWNAAHVLTGAIDIGNIAAGGNPGAIQFNNAGVIGGASQFFVDTNQRVSIGSTGLQIDGNAQLTVAGDSALADAAHFQAFNSQPCFIELIRTNSVTAAGHLAVLNNQKIGQITARGDDGTGYITSSWLEFTVDGAVSTGFVPGRIGFTTVSASGATLEAMRIDSNQHLLIGTTTDFSASTGTPSQIVIGTTDNFGVSAGVFSANTAGTAYNLMKSRNGTIGSHTIVQSGDSLGGVNYWGSDGTNWVRGGFVRCLVDAAPSAGHMPGRLVFTTSSVTTQDVEAMRIDSNQLVTIGGFASTTIAATPSRLQTVANNAWGFTSIAIGNNIFSSGVAFAKTRGSNPTTQVAVTANDGLLAINGYGSDGSLYSQAASINVQADATFSAGSSPGRFLVSTTPSSSNSAVERLRIDSQGNVAVCSGGGGVIPTNSINGFFYINTMGGNPSGVPAPPNALTGLVPMIYDTTNNRLWVRNAGTWRSVLLS